MIRWLSLMAALSLSLTAAALESGPMTVRDSIAKQVILVDYDNGEVAAFSPSGRHFFVVTSRGVLPSGEIEAAIWLFDGAAISAALRSGSREFDAKPRKIASISALSDGPPITGARWAADGESITFLGRGENAERHLLAVTIKDAQLRQLSPDGLDVTGYDRVQDTFVFTASPRASDAARYWQSAGPEFPDVHVGAGRSIFSLLYPESSTDVIDSVTEECLLRRIGCTVHSTEVWRVRNDGNAAVKAPGTSTPVRLSQSSGAELLLAPDGRRVVLTNAYLSAGAAPSVVAVDLASGKVSRIEDIEVGDAQVSVELSGIEWQKAGRRLVLRYARYHNATSTWQHDQKSFEMRNGAWMQIATSDATTAGRRMRSRRDLSIAVHQGINEPPVLTASRGASDEAKRIWDPNPQFSQLDLGEAGVYRWHDADGREWSGGLVKPPDYVRGRRYPLVIQTHGFEPNAFLTDGIFPTANAARPMAGRGIVVLQVGEIDVPKTVIDGIRMGRSEEAATMRAGYVAAIDKLAADGMIDPRKVGIIGFSWTGWYVWDCLMHAPERFAAATLAETTNMSVGEYTMAVDRPGNGQHVTEGIGAQPFGAGLQQWLLRSPGFRTDKIKAPILYQANSPQALVYGWDMYALLRLQHKPVDLLYIRSGEHVLTKPLHQLASQEMNVDWFDFWLNGHEDPDPAKAAQYRRWRAIKTLRVK